MHRKEKKSRLDKRDERRKSVPLLGWSDERHHGILNVFDCPWVSLTSSWIFLARGRSQTTAENSSHVMYGHGDHPWWSNPESSSRFHTKIIFITFTCTAASSPASSRTNLFSFFYFELLVMIYTSNYHIWLNLYDRKILNSDHNGTDMNI